jgi:hypothetical protein
MPVLTSPQKAFYDKFRPFQRNDSPKPKDAEVEPGVERGVPVGQLIAGAIVLALIVLAFFAFAMPEKPVGLDSHGKPLAKPAPAAPAR